MFHPRESDSSNYAFTEAQQKSAPLFFLQEGLFSAFTHKTHDEAAAIKKNSYSNREVILISQIKWIIFIYVH